MTMSTSRQDTVLITGGAGFFGSILKERLLAEGYQCVSIDLVKDDDSHERLTSIQGDINDPSLMEKLFTQHRFTCVFHIAAILAHDKEHRSILWASNVDATRLLHRLCDQHQVNKIIFTSSNCLWARNFSYAVPESEPPHPIEIYGRSKEEGEKILMEPGTNVRSVIFRCPTIVDSGRLGLLTILFDFIREGRKVWAVGGGHNRYQFIYAGDLVDACLKAMEHPGNDIFNIGSDHVPPLKEVYQQVIDHAGTTARVAPLPRWPILSIMKYAYWLGLSPLGPYHYKMIAEDFVFDTTKIKQSLHWQPTHTNGQMLSKAYDYYVRQRDQLNSRDTQRSAHKKPASMGVIRLLKWLS
jgi:UDP-glucose 4-epimerase